ncbi:NTPase [Dolichospermum sp. UHCC 0352]|nr:NTPase [Dolichospermum sp. UHCC 0299]MTJ21687.1 NTPase [Dolichospermum sp. UHCC 0352]MTJ39659.1 NTPase [Dolichospermum sp. UHCC 0406]
MNALKKLFIHFIRRLDMSQANTSINHHVEDYLNYYCALRHSPKFAILLKGKWGSGKTWFINQYREKLEEQGKKSLYVSLYGVSKYSEIEESLFQQLHPFRSSKGMVLAGKVFKGLLKGALKIDLNHDGKDDGTWNISIPDINIPDKFKDSNFDLLIFDDLERCSINIANILGYISSFVESQDLKVVIIANEDQINIKQEEYKRIKEKLIGKTFEIFPDFSGALNDFINQIEHHKIKYILLNNLNLIQELFIKAECKNLRFLNQISLDFERIFNILSEEAQKKSDLLEEILQLLTIFSIEISSARLKAEDISQLSDKISKEYASSEIKKYHATADLQENNIKDEISWLQTFERYGFVNLILNSPFPSLLWWENFFDKGIVDQDTLEKLMPNSKYFEDENTPNWLKLWYYTRHTDEEFEKILNQVESEYKKRKFEDIGIIKHITGLFLLFSDTGVYSKNKPDIIDESKKYIDELKMSGKLDIKYRDEIFDNYMGLVFPSKDSQEFKDFENYIEQCKKEVMLQNMPNEANKLLKVMQNNINELRPLICIPSSNYLDIFQETYYNFPIFKYLSPKDFMKTVFMLSNEKINYLFYLLQERYKYRGIVEKLVDELDFLKEVQKLLLAEVIHREGKMSGYILSLANKKYLQKIISDLEQIKNAPQPNNI